MGRSQQSGLNGLMLGAHQGLDYVLLRFRACFKELRLVGRMGSLRATVKAL